MPTTTTALDSMSRRDSRVSHKHRVSRTGSGVRFRVIREVIRIASESNTEPLRIVRFGGSE